MRPRPAGPQVAALGPMGTQLAAYRGPDGQALGDLVDEAVDKAEPFI
jgi:hypothetical protein